MSLTEFDWSDQQKIVETFSQVVGFQPMVINEVGKHCRDFATNVENFGKNSAKRAQMLQSMNIVSSFSPYFVSLAKINDIFFTNFSQLFQDLNGVSAKLQEYCLSNQKEQKDFAKKTKKCLSECSKMQKKLTNAQRAHKNLTDKQEEYKNKNRQMEKLIIAEDEYNALAEDYNKTLPKTVAHVEELLQCAKEFENKFLSEMLSFMQEITKVNQASTAETLKDFNSLISNNEQMTPNKAIDGLIKSLGSGSSKPENLILSDLGLTLDNMKKSKKLSKKNSVHSSVSASNSYTLKVNSCDASSSSSFSSEDEKTSEMNFKLQINSTDSQSVNSEIISSIAKPPSIRNFKKMIQSSSMPIVEESEYAPSSEDSPKTYFMSNSSHVDQRSTNDTKDPKLWDASSVQSGDLKRGPRSVDPWENIEKYASSQNLSSNVLPGDCFSQSKKNSSTDNPRPLMTSGSIKSQNFNHQSPPSYSRPLVRSSTISCKETNLNISPKNEIATSITEVVHLKHNFSVPSNMTIIYGVVHIFLPPQIIRNMANSDNIPKQLSFSLVSRNNPPTDITVNESMANTKEENVINVDSHSLKQWAVRCQSDNQNSFPLMKYQVKNLNQACMPISLLNNVSVSEVGCNIEIHYLIKPKFDISCLRICLAFPPSLRNSFGYVSSQPSAEWNFQSMSLNWTLMDNTTSAAEKRSQQILTASFSCSREIMNHASILCHFKSDSSTFTDVQVNLLNSPSYIVASKRNTMQSGQYYGNLTS